MKKLLLMLLGVSVLSVGMVYAENIDADASADDAFPLTHDVARISVFTIKKLAATINDGTNIIGKFEVKNNTSDGYYPNGGTPVHGCYSTIGIENRFGNIGLQYTFNNSYPEAATRLENESAIFITTDQYDGTLVGDVNYDGTLDILDLVGLANLILDNEYLSSGDMNQDEQLDILDIVSLVNVILNQ